MKMVSRALICSLVLICLSCNSKTKQDDTTVNINDKTFLVDVRTIAEFNEGSVEGAVNIPLDQVAQQIDQFKGKDNIVVFCKSGGRSGKAQKILTEAGILNVSNGGGWKDVEKLLEQ